MKSKLQKRVEGCSERANAEDHQCCKKLFLWDRIGRREEAEGWDIKEKIKYDSDLKRKDKKILKKEKEAIDLQQELERLYSENNDLKETIRARDADIEEKDEKIEKLRQKKKKLKKKQKEHDQLRSLMKKFMSQE